MKLVCFLLMLLVGISFGDGTIKRAFEPKVFQCIPTEQERMVMRINAMYATRPGLATAVVEAAHDYQRRDFPTARDIVAIVGIESSFNPNAKSKLQKDPAIGLTQIRPEAWSHKIKRHELDSIDGQIRHGADILAHYYKVLGDKRAAVQAYNVGLAGYRQGRYKEAAQRYVNKYSREVAGYSHIGNTNDL